jgi:hypothetical protein
MASWIADVRGIVFQLTQIGVSVPNEDFILALTNGLPPHYESLILVLDLTPSDLFSVDYVIRHLQTKESCQHTAVASEFGGTDSSDQALAAMLKRTGTAHITCFSCSQKGHYQANCLTVPVPPRPGLWAQQILSLMRDLTLCGRLRGCMRNVLRSRGCVEIRACTAHACMECEILIKIFLLFFSPLFTYSLLNPWTSLCI